jgi:hypothetical protein
MIQTSIVELSSIPGQPRVKLVLPIPLRLGDKLKLSFKLKRQNGGRLEVLDVQGEFRVMSSTQSVEHQYLSVESTGKEPAWRAVRRGSLPERKVPPAIFPRTIV